jgi:hypothetical protein
MLECYFVGMQILMLLQHFTHAAIHDACLFCQFTNIKIKNGGFAICSVGAFQYIIGGIIVIS